jgi:hypothetical protein
MKDKEEVLEYYKEYETSLDDRFGVRFMEFLTIEEMSKIGIELKDEYKKDWKPKKWTPQNIIEQLKEDVLFGMEKMSDERGISSELMHSVVKSWVKILGDTDLEELFNESYDDYGKHHLRCVAKKYNIDISSVDY